MLSGKKSVCNQETRVQYLGGEDLLEKDMATHSSILAWRIPWTVEPDGLQSIGSDMTEQLADTHTHTCSVTQSYLTLCNPMDSSSPGSSAYGIS